MKDFVKIWNNTNRRYSNCNPSDRELKDLSNNRLMRVDIDKSAYDANCGECEGLNSKFNDDIENFSDRKDAIINRLFERRKKGQVTRQPKSLFILLLLGFFSLSAGCFILFLHPYDFLFRQKSMLQDGGEIFEMWRKPEVDLYTRVFLFNITNAEAFMAGDEHIIKVKEIGPYVYREALEHNVTAFNENGTLSAIPQHPLTWVEELSEGNKEDDVLFLPHIALLSIANVVSQESFMTQFGLNKLITFTNSQPLVKMTAREFMMGYESQLMSLGNTFMPGWIYFDKLGLIDRMYDFKGDFETIFTGEDDVRNSGLIDTYRGSTDLPQWNGKHCSNVQYASDGTKFKGGVTKNETILFYRKSLCRAAPLIPTDEGEISGLKGYKYTFPKDMMDNGKNNEDNKCFCRNGRCLPDGLIDVTDCYYGFPIALSYPHFYEGEEVLSSKVEGLKPNRDEHETRFWIQPESGLPLDVSSKFQINMALGDLSSIENSGRFSNLYLPLLWFDITMSKLPPSLEQRFKLYINILPVVEQAIMYLSFITGACLILTTVYILTFKVMFKTFDQNQRNYNKDNWCDNEKNIKDGIYAACEIPLSETEDSDVPTKNRLKDLSIKLNDKILDTVGSVRDKLKFDRRGSKAEKNEGYKDSDTEHGHYAAVDQTDSQSDSENDRYLEILDDGCDFDTTSTSLTTERSKILKELDSETESDLEIHISH